MRTGHASTREASSLTTAVIFVPSDNIELFAMQCYQHCIAMDYEVVGLIRDDWPAAFALLLNGLADVLVAARPEHLDDIETDHITPRIEFAAPPDAPNARHTERRTRIIRPGEEG